MYKKLLIDLIPCIIITSILACFIYTSPNSIGYMDKSVMYLIPINTVAAVILGNLIKNKEK